MILGPRQNVSLRIISIAMQLQQTALPTDESGEEVVLLCPMHIAVKGQSLQLEGLLNAIIKIGRNDTPVPIRGSNVAGPTTFWT